MRYTLGALAALLNGTVFEADPQHRVDGMLRIDSRQIRTGDVFVALAGEQLDGHAFVAAALSAGAAVAIVTRRQPGAGAQLLVADAVVAMAHIAAHWRAQHDTALVCVTGSNGKTSVSHMLAALLREHGPLCQTPGNYNNHLGVPLALSALRATDRYGVIELGANHVGEIAGLARIAQPNVALVTNASEAHVSGFGSLAAIQHAKGEIFSALEGQGVAIINADDPARGLWHELAGQARVLRFGRADDADVRLLDSEPGQVHLDVAGQQVIFGFDLLGEHNALNICAVAAALLAVNAPLELLCTHAATLQPVAGRLQRRPTAYGRLIDDSYNANPASMQAAIDVLVAHSGETCLIVGDMAELGAGAEAQHQQLGQYARDRGVQHLIAVGQWAQTVVTAFGARGQVASSAHEAAALVPFAATVLVKGSRSSRMEITVQGVQARFSNAEQNP